MTAREKGLIALATGGTGGHVFPARALAGALSARGWRLAIVTDSRGAGFAVGGSEVETYRIKAASPGRGAGGKLRRLVQIGAGLFQARALLRRLQPAAVVGFGGYASVPTMLAATHAGLPTLIHEQNAVLGRANRLLAPRVRCIAASFDHVERARPRDADKIIVTGNPVRAEIAALGEAPYPAPDGGRGPLHLLVFGGSQGAHILSAVVPAAIATLSSPARMRIRVVQQCRAEDIDAVRANYDAAGVQAELAAFFDDMPARLKTAQLVIGRAGASTVAELAAAGRPAVLAPYPHATDDHQTANARAAEATGAAWLVPDAAFTAEAVGDRLDALMANPGLLETAAAAAHRFARRDAAERLADAVEALALPRSNGNGHHPNLPEEKAA
jgi:UDP-N-acetylglucosamine--N-acetylmuramyl-(pentapeptide) pyrophosphoryl-undecaprenol N-acetylglucosamine transferase